MIENILSKVADSELKAPNVDASDLLNTGIYIALWGVGVMSVAVILYAALRIVTARDDVEKAKKGKRAIIWGMIGLGIALLASFITNLVIKI
jgi:uncharacterized membrane protein YidH (DUF202 family)